MKWITRFIDKDAEAIAGARIVLAKRSSIEQSALLLTIKII